MELIPFLKPKVVTRPYYQRYLDEIDASRLYTNNGPLNKRFEARILQEYFRCEGDVVTVSNATIGLLLAISQMKRPGKYALMPSFTFPATPLSTIWCGLEPYYVDIDMDRWCMDEDLLEMTLKKLGDEAAVVVPYATFGTQLDLNYYSSLIKRGIPVVIDAASSFGTTMEQQDITRFEGAMVYSFHATKSFGIGEGGIVYSGNRELIQRIRCATNFGFNEERVSSQLGLNGKISEYTAAIGLATLDVFSEKIRIREKIGEWYKKAWSDYKLEEAGWRLQAATGKITYQFYPLLCPPEQENIYYVNKLRASAIQVRTYFSPPCHRQEMFRLHPRTSLTATEEISRRILSLPVWEDISQEQVDRIVRSLGE
ncbi:DegT/DnrJ/EryC1/StrS family aminotransferase [Paenibacillus ihumii]|uniref:DegT/DnrJ/EryC1/StrS family aminotransferase n=1 Tax=Paenibacillus ihumii TaxID=687436 RepID=UPI0006D774E5|nr:aminotransferase class I/II-fold pyridoxal phosphate-dependent enzyme [Paenibacillus ihumii]